MNGNSVDHRNTVGYVAESIMWDFVEDVVTLMESKNISRTELAHRAKLAPAQITRILSGDHNLTVKTLSKVAVALEMNLKLNFIPRSSVNAGKKVISFSGAAIPENSSFLSNRMAGIENDIILAVAA
jgi:transcriptional regulator with XRE-family HTH domain